MSKEARELADFYEEKGQPDFASRARDLARDSAIAGLHQISTGQTRARQQERLPSRLKLIPFEIDIPEVSEEMYAETRRAVETAIPGVFITYIRPLTMEDLLIEDIRRGHHAYRRFAYVNESKTMQAILPLDMEVFINPKAVRIIGSNDLSTDEQYLKIAEETLKLREQLPERVRPFVDMHMVDPSTMSQLEDRYMDENNGALLLPNFFARTDAQITDGVVAGVGRFGHGDHRFVDDWKRDRGYNLVYAVPVGVLPRKLMV